MRPSDGGPARHVLGGYREYAPPPDLAPVVDASWTYSLPPGSPAAAGHNVLPDTGLSLCFWQRGTGSGANEPSLVVVGPVRRVRRGPGPGERLEAVRLRPEWCVDLLGIDPGEQVDALIPLNRFRPRDAARLLDRHRGSPERGAGLRLLLGLLRDRFARPASGSAVLAARALTRIRAARTANIRLDSVARSLGVSERHLRRVIRETTGSGPKHHHRVARLNRTVAAADREVEPRWSRLAVRHGFYDQSHMIREFGALAGYRPVVLHEERLRENRGVPTAATGPPGR